MVRRVARLPTAELLELPQARTRRERRGGSGADASHVVVDCGAGDCSVAGSPKPRSRNSDECTRSREWELALALPGRDVVSSSFSMAAGTDIKFKALGAPKRLVSRWFQTWRSH